MKKTDRKPCSIREQVIGIVIVSKRDFDNVTGVVTSTMHCRGFLETILMFRELASFVPFLFSAVICICLGVF